MDQKTGISEAESSENNTNPLPQAPPVVVSSVLPSGSNRLSVVGFILAFLLPPVGVVISILAWRKAAKNHLRGKGLAIAGTIIGIVITPVLYVAASLILVLVTLLIVPANRANQAKVDLQPISRQVVALGGREICDDGDNGYSLDNNIPWYDVYYKVSDTNLLPTVESAAKRQGYNLTETNNTNQQSDTAGSQIPNTHDSYLTDTKGGRELDVQVVRDGSDTLSCTSSSPTETVSGSMDIIELGMTLPATNN